MRVALSSRYGRRDELRGYAADLRALGHTITSCWLTDTPAWNDDGVRLADSAAVNREVARQDLADIDECDILIGFTDAPGSPNRGGKDREIGYAMGCWKRVLLVGPIQTCFDLHPSVTRFDDWQACLDYLKTHELAATR